MNDQNFNGNYTPPGGFTPVDVFPSGGNSLKRTFASGMFLAMCILTTVSVLLSTMSLNVLTGRLTVNPLANILGLLIVIGMWITYASAQDLSTDGIKSTGFSMVSGTIKAIRIIMWVVIGLIMASGVMLIVTGAVAGDTLGELILEYAQGEVSAETYDMLYQMLSGGMAMLILVACGIGVILVAVITLILNLTFYRCLHRLARSLADNAKGISEGYECATGASNWLIVMAVFMGITAISSLWNGNIMSVGNCCNVATYIIAAVLIKNNLV